MRDSYLSAVGPSQPACGTADPHVGTHRHCRWPGRNTAWGRRGHAPLSPQPLQTLPQTMPGAPPQDRSLLGKIPGTPPPLSSNYGAKYSISFVLGEAQNFCCVKYQGPTPHRLPFRLTECPLRSQGSSRKRSGAAAAQALGGTPSPPLQTGCEMPPALLTAPPTGSPVHLWQQRLR